ncbi:replication initiator protein A [Staphylococcus pseudintermedius]|nr:replication initiator protein A [Staphylococcus pseudintermedius]
MNHLIEYLIQSKYLTLDNFEINKNFYIFPRAFVDIEYYKEMIIDAKYLYAILYNRAQISRETGWVDENQRIYFIYKNLELLEASGIGGEKRIINAKRELVAKNLLVQKRLGQGKANRLYLLFPMSQDEILRIKNEV